MDESLAGMTAEIVDPFVAGSTVLTLRENGRPAAKWAWGAHASLAKPIAPAAFKEIVAALVPT